MRRLILGVLAVGLLTACVSGETVTSTNPVEAATRSTSGPTLEWGEEAVSWREALIAAGEEGTWNQAGFWAEDIVVEDRPETNQQLHGRESYIGYSIGLFGTMLPDIEPGSLFLSADEALDQYAIGHPNVSDPDNPVDYLTRMRVGPHGIEHIVGAASVQNGYEYVPEEKDSHDKQVELANRYVEFWNGTDTEATDDLYLPEASIEDTLLGGTIRGTEAIAGSLETRQWPDLPPMQIVALPDDGGPAIYGGHPVPYLLRSSPAFLEVHLILEVDDGTGCPGLVGVALGWDQERVVWERRYHEVGAVRRCMSTEGLQSGWWEGMEIPSPIRIEHTGTMTWGEKGISVEIFNGIPATDEFVRWGLERYDQAGLAVPSVGSVTFLVDETTCQNFFGFSTGGPDADIILCNRPDQVCQLNTCDTWKPYYEAALLHEYGHVWISENLDDATQARCLEHIHVHQWTDPDIPHTQQGVEYAANTLIYGLLDDDIPALVATDWNCQQREQAFRLLTGAEPISTCQP